MCRGYSDKSAQQLKSKMPTNVKFDMRGLCGYLCIDEAQSVKNIETDIHQACKMLKPPFTILATGTPDISRFSDIRGLMHFVQLNK